MESITYKVILLFLSAYIGNSELYFDCLFFQASTSSSKKVKYDILFGEGYSKRTHGDANEIDCYILTPEVDQDTDVLSWWRDQEKISASSFISQRIFIHSCNVGAVRADVFAGRTLCD